MENTSTKTGLNTWYRKNCSGKGEGYYFGKSCITEAVGRFDIGTQSSAGRLTIPRLDGSLALRVVVRIAALRDLAGLKSACVGEAGAASTVVSPFLGLFPRILSVYWRVSGNWNLYEHLYCVSAYHMLLEQTRFLDPQSVYDPRDVFP